MFLNETRTGRRRWLALALAAAAAPVLAGTAVLSLDLSMDDVDAVAFVAGGAVVRLRPKAAERLRTITGQSIGRVLELSIDGTPALTVRVQAEIASGIVQLPDPSPVLHQQLQVKAASAPAR